MQRHHKTGAEEQMGNKGLIVCFRGRHQFGPPVHLDSALSNSPIQAIKRALTLWWTSSRQICGPWRRRKGHSYANSVKSARAFRFKSCQKEIYHYIQVTNPYTIIDIHIFLKGNFPVVLFFNVFCSTGLWLILWSVLSRHPFLCVLLWRLFSWFLGSLVSSVCRLFLVAWLLVFLTCQ